MSPHVKQKCPCSWLDVISIVAQHASTQRGAKKKKFQNQLLDIIGEHVLTHVVNTPIMHFQNDHFKSLLM